MLKKILRVVLVLLTILLLLLAGAGVAINSYLKSGKQEMLDDLAEKTGLEVAFADLDFRFWSTFPVLKVSIDSLVLRDSERPSSEPALLSAEKIVGAVSLAKLLTDTLMIQQVSIRGGGLYVKRDSVGTANLGHPPQEPAPASPPELPGLLNPALDWGGVVVRLEDFDVAYHYAAQHKKMEFYLDSLQTIAERGTGKEVHFDVKMEADVKGIAFNTLTGHYLDNSSLRGEVLLSMRDTAWALAPSYLYVNDERYKMSLLVGRNGRKSLDLEVEKDAINYEEALALLPRALQKKLSNYGVSGPFQAQVKVKERPDEREDPEISVDFAIAGQDVTIEKHFFSKVHTSGNFTNRLAAEQGGVPGSKQNFLVKLDSTEGYWGKLLVKMPQAVLRGTRNDLRLRGPVRAFGPSDEINDVVKTRDFIFKGGRFQLNTFVDASLNSVDEIITTSDGKLTFRQVDVMYRPAGIVFPLRYLEMGKREKDIQFALESSARKSDFAFKLEGKLDNLLPLLLDRPAENIRTDVTLTAPRLGWTDFLNVFGEDGVLSPEEEMSDKQRKESMKKALLGLQGAFHPSIEVEIDTVAYFDVFSVLDFKTGMRFDGDTLVLERTTFNWEESDFGLSARLGLKQPAQTPFRLGINAENLDLNRLRPSLEYFGLSLPEGLDSLPADLNIDFYHKGVIDDTLGIAPGYNFGKLAFKEGTENQFAGTLAYRPGPEGIQSQLQLDGDPSFINHLFAAEDFFFGSGKFRINLDITGTPARLSDLMENSVLRLEIDSSRITYRPAAVYLPIRRFVVDAKNEQATFELELFSEFTRSHVNVSGVMDRLTAFLYPDLGRSFTMKADATAQSIRLSDFQYLMPAEVGATVAKTDTGSFNLRQSLMAAEGIFSSFRPDVSLKVDTFFANDGTEFTDIYAGFRRDDSTRLILEKSGFSIAGGEVEFSATYDYNKEKQYPFAVEWKTDSLALEALSRKADNIKGLSGTLPKALRGILFTEGKFEGVLNDQQKKILMDQTVGEIDLRLTDAEISNWSTLQKIGRKLRMRKRFERVKMTPLLVKMNFDSGQVWLPETEIQSTPLQLFVEGSYDTLGGADLLISIPLRNIGRGVLTEVPPLTGYAQAGRKVYLVVENDKDGAPKVRFRLGRKRYFRDRGRLGELKSIKAAERELRKAARQERRRKRRIKE
ncbi:AsmA family protein [Neolewinella agarilytica]|uniref:AsmA-like C-terminal region n=1 Tax=Neolewinella agarilytica TaxID=478744 RepID=A0A1H9JSI1_9BACT|nr:hypothetical protein [Neolewinella agarilytica]SEQ89961.1 hypothetical protein SAMN05444359_11858 [Neolewinella agarilytica]